MSGLFPKEGCDAALDDASLSVPVAVLTKMLKEAVEVRVSLQATVGQFNFCVAGGAGDFTHAITRLDLCCVPHRRRAEPASVDPFLQFVRDERRQAVQQWTRVIDTHLSGVFINDTFAAELRVPAGFVVATGPRCRVCLVRCDTSVAVDVFRGTKAQRKAALAVHCSACVLE